MTVASRRACSVPQQEESSRMIPLHLERHFYVNNYDHHSDHRRCVRTCQHRLRPAFVLLIQNSKIRQGKSIRVAVLLALFYWRGYMASLGALCFLIILVFVLHTLFGKEKLGQLISHLPSSWLILAIALLFITAMCYFCSVLEKRRNI